MLIRFLLVQRNPLDLCYFLAFFNDRYWKLKLNILKPISIFPSFREYINAFNKYLHELFLFCIRKAVIDKLFSFYNAKVDLSGKECALISCCEENDESVFDGVRVPIERSAALLNWKMVGTVLVPAVVNVGDIDKTEGCSQAAALADKF